jgi:hypothetical protein
VVKVFPGEIQALRAGAGSGQWVFKFDNFVTQNNDYLLFEGFFCDYLLFEGFFLS